jgi:hypothetical protein
MLGGDTQTAGKYVALAKHKLASLKHRMSLGDISQSSDINKPGAATVSVHSAFGHDTIRIKGAERSFSEFNLIFAHEWGLQGFKISGSDGNLNMTPVDIVPNENDIFSLAPSGHVELDIFGNPVWVKGSCVSSIDRDKQLYTFKVNRSSQDIAGGMAYDLYADKILSYGTPGFRANPADPFNISEDYSAGTDLVYTPFIDSIPVNPVHGNPYGYTVGGSDIDALGRRPYKIDFKNKVLQTNGEYVARSRTTRYDAMIFVNSLPYFSYIYWTDPDYPLPDGLTPTRSYSEGNGRTTLSCLGGVVTPFFDPASYPISYHNTLHGEWDSIRYYQELDTHSNQLIKKGVPLFKDFFDLDLQQEWGEYIIPVMCLTIGFGASYWYLKRWHVDVVGTKYDVRACLGDGKFIYDKENRHNIFHTSYFILLQGSEGSQAPFGLYGTIDNHYDSTTSVYIGDTIFKTNHYSRRQQTYYPNGTPGTAHPVYTLPTPQGLYTVTSDGISQEETYFMDYDYDLQKGKNGVFFYQNIKTDSLDYNNKEVYPVGYAAEAGNQTVIWDKKVTHSFGVAVMLNGAIAKTELASYDWIQTRRFNYYWDYYLGLTSSDDTGTYNLRTSGTRIWLTSSYISDKEIVYSYLIENVHIDENGAGTFTPNKRVTTVVNIGNEGLAIGHHQSFTAYPVSNNPHFTITTKKKTGPGDVALSLKITVVAMTTINMSIPHTFTEVELGPDEYFNVSYPEVSEASHYGILISPTSPAFLYGGGDPEEWYKPIITSELSIDITRDLLSTLSGDTRSMAMQGIWEDKLKLDSPKLTPAIGIHRTQQ